MKRPASNREPLTNETVLHFFPNADALAETVAERWLNEIAAHPAAGRPLTVALSGGRITTRLFASMVAQSQERRLALDHVHFFWADERCVPATDGESNYRQANELLFMPLLIAAGQIHRIPGELDPELAAGEAAADLRRVAPANAADMPVLDLVLLGMGEDGHVASLFPGAGREVVEYAAPYLVIRQSPKPPPTRISLSYAAIGAARKIWVLASGAGKEKALEASLAPGGLTPLGRVLALSGDSQVFTELKRPQTTE